MVGVDPCAVAGVPGQNQRGWQSLEVNRASAVLIEQKTYRVHGGLASDAIRQ